MLGADKVPQSLLSDRFCRSGSTERWREPWDRFDGTLDVWLKTINELRLPVPVPVQSFRSNRCGISVVNEASGWVVAWDERFFDYVLLQLQLLRHESEQAVRWPLFRWLIQYVGEGYAVSDPYYAISLLHAATCVPSSGGESRIAVSRDFLDTLECYFRIMRMFVLAHEVGHIALKQPKVRERELKNLETAIELVRDVLADAPFRESIEWTFWGNGSHESLLKRVLALAQHDSVSEEMLADAFAVSTVMSTEIGMLRHEETNPPTEKIVLVLNLVYESIMLLYFIAATMNGVREWLKPKSIQHKFKMTDFRSVSALSARANIRGMLWTIFSNQELGGDIAKARLLREHDIGLRKNYLDTQVPAYETLRGSFDRVRVLREADDLRQKIDDTKARRRAAECYGFATSIG